MEDRDIDRLAEREFAADHRHRAADEMRKALDRVPPTQLTPTTERDLVRLARRKLGVEPTPEHGHRTKGFR
jgi:hypothetical protein